MRSYQLLTQPEEANNSYRHQRSTSEVVRGVIDKPNWQIQAQALSPIKKAG
jgi:hypothetical protein